MAGDTISIPSKASVHPAKSRIEARASSRKTCEIMIRSISLIAGLGIQPFFRCDGDPIPLSHHTESSPSQYATLKVDDPIGYT